MAIFVITFIGGGTGRLDEEVDADHYVDNPPFVDFRKFDQATESDVTVARYRADDIRRILRSA